MRLLLLLCSSHKTPHFLLAKDAKIFKKRHSKSYGACETSTTATKTHPSMIR